MLEADLLVVAISAGDLRLRGLRAFCPHRLNALRTPSHTLFCPTLRPDWGCVWIGVSAATGR